MLKVTRFSPDGPTVTTATFDPASWPPGPGEIVWIDLEAPTDRELAILADPFHFHPLAIEDCVTPEHQPKIEDFGPYLFLIFRGIDFNPPVEAFQTQKLGAFLGPDYLVTYHRRPLQSVDAIHAKHELPESQGLCKGASHLLYEILDLMIERYFPVLEQVEEELDALEKRIFADPSPETLDGILEAKRRVVEVKRAIVPHRELFGRIGRGEFEEIEPGLLPFYRDLYDSTYRLADVADSYRDLLSGTMDAYLSVVSHRLNEVMKVLTIFATILLPLTFIAGVYGMNFEHIPELGWRYGYFAVWGVMLAIALGMLVFFRRRGWM
ncbi:MAG TPA: magnesium/cobalt transporter CorA [Gemmatimonadota bacterium]|nr:magnesium/cobalt transporter CorA [Gemmatimonadota bacterium]